MFFNINGIELGRNDIYIESPVGGLGSVPVRTGSGVWSGRDGGYVSTQFYDQRIINIRGFYIGKTCEHADELRKVISSAFPIRKPLPVFIETMGGFKYFTWAYLDDLKIDYDTTKSGVYQATLICPDPLLYDAGDGVDPNSNWQQQAILKYIGGGYITAYDMPVEWTPGINPSPVVNEGDAPVKPQIVIRGQVHNPRIINVTTNEFVELNVITAETDEIIIDHANRLVTINGRSILDTRDIESSWWELEPGNNIIRYESANEEDVNHVIVRWRSGYAGI